MLEDFAKGRALTVLERDDLRGLDVVRSFAPFQVGASRQTWVLSVSVPERDALSNAHRLVFLSVGVGLVAGLVSLFLGGVMARALIRPIELLTLFLGRENWGFCQSEGIVLTKHGAAENRLGRVEYALVDLERSLARCCGREGPAGRGALPSTPRARRSRR